MEAQRLHGGFTRIALTVLALALSTSLLPAVAGAAGPVRPDSDGSDASISPPTVQQPKSHQLPPTGLLRDDCDPHPPIRIQGDLMFELGLAAGVVDGDGTAHDPYVIEGWCITPPMTDEGDGLDVFERAGILIEDTSAHVVIRNNVIYSRPLNENVPQVDETQKVGIRLADADHVKIENNQITGHYRNVDAGNSLRLTVADNEFSFGTVSVSVHDSSHPTVEDNLFRKDGTSVRFHNSNGIQVEHNTFRKGFGVLLDAAVTLKGTTDATVEANEITSKGRGVEVKNSEQVTVTQNNIHDTRGTGLYKSGGEDHVDARHNWWGAVDGPSGGHDDRCTSILADGSGDDIRTRQGQFAAPGICFDPWLQTPNKDAGRRT